MATIKEYTTGQICEQLKRAFSVMDATKNSLNGTDIGDIMLAKVNKMTPKKIPFEKAIELIQKSEKCAIGPRVCLAVHKDARYTDAIFLNDLATGMTNVGKAKTVTKTEAIETMKRYSKNPIIISKVSGQYAEICPTWPQRCLYWNMEKHGLKCIGR